MPTAPYDRRLRASLRVYAALFVQMLKVRLAYKGDFLFDLLATGLGGIASLLFVLLLFHRITDLAGWSRAEILFIYGLSMVSYGLFGTVSWNLYEFGDRYVVQGRFDRVLLRPVGSFGQVMCDSFRVSALSESIIGLGVLWWSARKLALEPTVLGVAAAIAATLSGAAIFIAVFAFLSSLSFHFEDRIGISPPVFNLIAFSRYPQTIFPTALQFVMRWIIPFGFVSFYPATFLLGRSRLEGLALMAPVVALVFALLTAFAWRIGVRSYESTGS